MNRIFALTAETAVFEEVEMAQEDIEVRTFDEPLAFLEAFLTLHSQIAVLDIDLLQAKSEPMIHIIRHINKKTPLVVILSKENMPICLSVFSLGIVSYLIKPLSPENLGTLLRSMIHQ